MDNNTLLIFGFSLLIALLSILMFTLMSKEYTQMAENEKKKRGYEKGPRAYLFNQLYEFFSENESNQASEKEKYETEVSSGN